jgi:hypothetical protein
MKWQWCGITCAKEAHEGDEGELFEGVEGRRDERARVEVHRHGCHAHGNAEDDLKAGDALREYQREH